MTQHDAPKHDDLPLPDYDHLPVGSLEARIKTLDADGLAQVLAYEKAHGNRLAVVRLLEQRADALAGGAAPTEGSPLASAPETDVGQPGGSPVTPETEGPKINPPSQGVPTNPAQPRR
jgi:hypothetical protein